MELSVGEVNRFKMIEQEWGTEIIWIPHERGWGPIEEIEEIPLNNHIALCADGRWICGLIEGRRREKKVKAMRKQVFKRIRHQVKNRLPKELRCRGYTWKTWDNFKNRELVV
jgi:hypothetical protein